MTATRLCRPGMSGAFFLADARPEKLASACRLTAVLHFS
jgi:hypothetical protein